MAAYDLLTLDDVKSAVNFDLDIADKDAEFESIAEGVTGFVEDEIGPVVARTVTGARLPVYGVDRVSFDVPVLSVTSVGSRLGSVTTTLAIETNVSFPTAGVLLEGAGTLNSHLLYRSNGTTLSFTQGATLIVTYVAGRYLTLDDVPKKFTECAKAVAAAHWRMWAPAWARSPRLADGDEYSAATPPAEMVRQYLPRELLLPGIG